VAIIKTAADYVGEVPFALAVPPVVAVVTLIFVFWWVYAAVYLYSVGNYDKQDGVLPYGQVRWSNDTRYMFYYFVFGFLWVTAFLMSLNQFILASSACIWYFSPRKKDA